MRTENIGRCRDDAPVREAAKERATEGRKQGGGDRKSEDYKNRSVEQIPQSEKDGVVAKEDPAPKTRDIRAKVAGQLGANIVELIPRS